MNKNNLNIKELTEKDLEIISGGGSDGFWHGVGSAIGYVHGVLDRYPTVRNKDW
ncbi:hypothetical protein ACT5YT_11065 [Leuconostoc suionicum]|uniref:hypothetical protein n=1 Tax=Leuconostoc suionicum TaxID=1511761 RepID=UPI00403643F6